MKIGPKRTAIFFIRNCVKRDWKWATIRFFKDKKGYKRFSDSGIPVHRYVAERKLGRNLKKGEVVHHINRNKNDNRRTNLWVFKSQKAHDTTHRRDKKRFGKW